MPIQTATLEQCVSGLKRTIDSQAATIEHQARQLQDARAWAALWKRAAKWHRHGNMMRIDVLMLNMELKERNQRQAAEIERLRGALNQIDELQSGSEWKHRCDAGDIARAALDADHDAR